MRSNSLLLVSLTLFLKFEMPLVFTVPFSPPHTKSCVFYMRNMSWRHPFSLHPPTFLLPEISIISHLHYSYHHKMHLTVLLITYLIPSLISIIYKAIKISFIKNGIILFPSSKLFNNSLDIKSKSLKFAVKVLYNLAKILTITRSINIFWTFTMNQTLFQVFYTHNSFNHHNLINFIR